MTPTLEVAGLSKNYGGLRPLRIAAFTLIAGESAAILGVDQSSAEVLVNLLTGATLPDEGEVRVFGRPTAAIRDSADWLALLDRVGIVSERAVLLDAMSVVQNLAMPFSLEIEPPPPEVRRKAEQLASEVGLAPEALHRAVGELGTAGRFRVRCGRALALAPELVLFEHPSALLSRAEISSLASEIRAVIARRRASSLVLTADREFALAAAARVLTLDPATGRLSERRRWFG